MPNAEPARDRRAERRDSTRAEILEAAWELCRTQGLAGLSLRDVARKIGMRPPSLYWYFDSKQAIYDAMFAQGNRQLLERLAQQRWFLWMLTGLNAAVAVYLFFRMPESPRWLEARERRDQARKIVQQMEARVMKRHPVLPEPDLSPYEVVAQENTPWWAPFGRNYVVVTVFLLVVMILGYGGIVYGGASQILIFLTINRGYSAGFIFAMTAWAGVIATAIYILNAYFGDRLERKWSSSAALSCSPAPIGACTRCTARWACTSSTLFRLSAGRCGCGACTCTYPQLPDPDALAGHRLDRRRGPPRRLGRRPDRRSALHRDRPAALLPVRHDPVRAAARPPGRGLRETPARPRTRRTVPVAAGLPAG